MERIKGQKQLRIRLQQRLTLSALCIAVIILLIMGAGYRKPMPVLLGAGPAHSYFVDEQGRMWCWGDNSSGQIGFGHERFYSSPVPVLDNVIFAAAVSGRTVAITSDNTLYGWGSNQNRALRGEDTEEYYRPVRLMDRVASTTMFNDQTYVVTTDGELWAWGNLPVWINSTPEGQTAASHRVQIDGDVAQVAAGSNYLVILKRDGSVWTVGENAYGQLGDGTTQDRSEPVKVLEQGASVYAGAYQAFVLKQDGTLWGWGGNSVFGSLGDGTREDRNAPMQIMEDVTKFSVAAGLSHSMALTSDSTLWIWGADSHGQLGIDSGSGGYVLSPYPIMEGVSHISAHLGRSLALQRDGALWVWGSNSSGAVGNGSKTDRANSPVQIMAHVSDISASASTTMAYRTDGSLWMWGQNDNGELGDGTTDSKSIPTQVLFP